MKIIINLGTGALLTFPSIENIKPNCFNQGYAILQKLAVYHGPGPNQGWTLKNSKLEVGGWYCE